MMRPIPAALIVALLAPVAHANEAHHTKGAAQGATQSGAISEGEVRRVDKEGRKITLRHGPLVNLDMPGMTMVFQVKDPAMVDQVKVGDKVKFRAEKEGSTFIVTELQPAK